MLERTYKQLAVAALIVATSALGISVVQRIEIQSLKRKVEAQNPLDQLAGEIREKLAEKVRRIEKLNPDLRKELEDFKLPAPNPTLQQRIDESNLVLVTESKIDGDRLVQVVKEVIKLKADVISYYEVGHPVGHPTPLDSFSANPEGSIVFCSGSPADETSASYIHNGRIGSFSDIPAAAAINQVKEAASSRLQPGN